jgi:hypothetical protein
MSFDINYNYCAQHDATKTKWKENIKPSEFRVLNNSGFGIFKSVNIFQDNIRKKSHLKKIVSFAIDIDDKTKDWQAKKILHVGIEPSKIIESKRGYHIYWNLRGDCELKNYEFIVGEMLIPIFSADQAAKDVTRVLRLEGFNHCKNGNYLIKKIYESKAQYTESLFFHLLLDYSKKNKVKINTSKILSNNKIVKKLENNISRKTAHEIAMYLGAKKVGENTYLCCCPAHDEKTPSFRIDQKGDKVLFKCFGSANCSQSKIIKKLMELNLWP